MAELLPGGLQGLCPAGRCDSIPLWGWHPARSLGSSCSGGVTQAGTGLPAGHLSTGGSGLRVSHRQEG